MTTLVQKRKSLIKKVDLTGMRKDHTWGFVANGGADQTKTFTGWRLKDSGSGNMTNVLSGFTYSSG